MRNPNIYTHDFLLTLGLRISARYLGPLGQPQVDSQLYGTDGPCNRILWEQLLRSEPRAD